MTLSQAHDSYRNELFSAAIFDEYQRELCAQGEEVLRKDGNQMQVFITRVVAGFGYF
jgi:hypothetical protein